VEIHCKYDELVSIEKLKKVFNPDNPNTHPEDQINILGEILKYQGIRREAIISKRSNLLTQGHGRILASEKIGLKEYPVTFQDYDDEEQEYADMVADNALNQRSILDFSMINYKITDLGPELDIKMLGLKGFEIEPADKFIQEINRGDENSEWAKIENGINNEIFSKGEGYITIVYHFKSEKDREEFVNNNGLIIDLKKNNQWIIYK